MDKVVSKVIDKTVVEPIEDTKEVIYGLLDGDIKTKPAVRLAVDYAVGGAVIDLFDDLW